VWCADLGKFSHSPDPLLILPGHPQEQRRAGPRPWIYRGTAHLHAQVLESAILLPRCPDLSFARIRCSPARVGSPEQLASHAQSCCLTGSRGAQELPAGQLAAPVVAALGHCDLHSVEHRCVDPKATSQHRAAMGPLGAAAGIRGSLARVELPEPVC
jgi:hypothetical protein